VNLVEYGEDLCYRERAKEPVVAIKLTAPTLALTLAVVATSSPSVAQANKTRTSAARERAIRECNIAAAKYVEHVWADWDIQTYRSCMARHGQPE
jgi:hypothetical protein